VLGLSEEDEGANDKEGANMKRVLQQKEEQSMIFLNTY
jgi:hypothetical protein